MECKYCESKAIKNGKQSNGTQRWLCGSCGKSFQGEYIYEGKKLEVKALVLKCHRSGCGFRATYRITGIAVSTQQRWVRKVAKQLRAPVHYHQGDEYEVDELKTYYGSKDKWSWVISAFSRKTKQIVALGVGRRTKKNLSKVTDLVRLLNPQAIYTDKLKEYKTIIPEELHRTKKYATNNLERFHLTMRTNIKRLNRRTICYSKTEEMLLNSVKLFVWGHDEGMMARELL